MKASRNKWLAGIVFQAVLIHPIISFALGNRPPTSLKLLDFSSTVILESAISQGLEATPVPGGGLRITSNPGEGRGLTLRAPGDISASDWSEWAALFFDLENPGAEEIRVEVNLRSAPGTWDDGKVAQFKAAIPAGSRALWRIPIFHMRYTPGWEWPRQAGLGHIESWGRTDTSAICEVSIIPDRGKKEVSLDLHRLHLGEPAKTQGWIDRFGQRADGNWPTKVRDEDDIKAADHREEAALRKPRTGPDWDEYRAWNEAPARDAAGFFRVEEIDGRWWFIAPNGRLWFATGIDVIGSGGHARLDETVEKAHSWLPPKEGPFSKSWHSDWAGGDYWSSPSLYRANLIRKWGPDEFEARCVERAIDRMIAWNFTSIGNWSDRELFEARKLPYFTMGPHTWDAQVPYATEKIHDAFHPDFPDQARRAAKMLERFRDDPWCVGHFVDNEVDWRDFPRRVLELPRDQPARAEWIKRLKAKYGTIEALNEGWGVSAASFDALRWPPGWRHAAKGALDDLAEYRGEFARSWYRIWAAAIRETDPNHLLLGSRLHGGNRFPEVIKACADYMDVVSFNHYDLSPSREEYDRYYEIARKPFLIGEYGFNSLDAGLLTTAVPVADQKDRGIGYRYYTEQMASIPYFVGGHYFQYLDEPVTGRGDRETSYNGFVTVADIPYPNLVKAAVETNARIYEVHAGKTKPFSRLPRR